MSVVTSSTWLFAATVAGCYFLFVTLFNIAYLRRTRSVAPRTDGPLVSIIVPARNEEHNIAGCIDSLLSQNYGPIEIIVVDDDSEDRTAEIAAAYSAENSEVTVVSAGPLPTGWMGKQHACSEGVRYASGELLFLTDADVVHTPDSVGYAVAAIEARRASFLSGYVGQDMRSFGERLIVPMTYIITALLLPIPFLTSRLFPEWALAIGQYMLIRRDALEAIGGYAALKESLVEDMAMARAVKAAGKKTAFVDARAAATCRMYDGYRAAFRGFAKCIFGAVGGRAWVIGALAAAVLLFIVLPFVTWGRMVLTHGLPGEPAAAPVVLFFITWALTLYDRRVPPGLALLYPLAFANLVLLGAVSMLRTGFGAGIEWKGRLVRCGRPDLPDPEILNAVGVYRFVSFLVYSFVFALVVVYNKVVFGLRVEGRSKLRELQGGFFLISNHSLYLDPAIVAHAVFPRRTYFTALEETFDRRFLGGFIRLLGAFPLPEAFCLRRIMPAVEWALNRGKCVHFFPEGELYHYNHRPAEFSEGVFYLAHRFRVPVVPVTLVVTPRRLFGREIARPLVRVSVMIGEPLYPSDLKREAVRAMARRAREEMSRAIEEARCARHLWARG